MDRLCIDLGTLLDNGDVKTLEEPYEHSIHCLVDIASCRRGPFEILTDPVGNSSRYVRSYQVDDAARTDLVRLAREVGDCDTCFKGGFQRKGFRASLNGTVTELGGNGLPHKLKVSGMEVVEVISGTNNAPLLAVTLALSAVLTLFRF